MRIKTTHKVSKGKTEKQKKINKERRKKGPKLNPNYKDMTPYNVGGVSVNLTVLTYGMIDSCNLTFISVNKEMITLNNGWIEAILIMMDTFIENYPDNYKDKCLEYDITSYDFTVDELFGKYNFEGSQYKAYKLYSRDIYIESTFSCESIFKAIVGLTKALGIGLDEIEFHLVNKNFKESRLNYASVSSSEKIVNIDEVADVLNNKGCHLVSMKLLDTVTEVHRIDVALVAFCKIMYEVLEDDLVLLGGNNSTGICTNDTETESQSMQIGNSNYKVYTDLDTDGIVAFMQTSMRAMNQDSDELKFKFEVIDVNAPKHEWEID